MKTKESEHHYIRIYRPGSAEDVIEKWGPFNSAVTVNVGDVFAIPNHLIDVVAILIGHEYQRSSKEYSKSDVETLTEHFVNVYTRETDDPADLLPRIMDTNGLISS